VLLSSTNKKGINRGRREAVTTAFTFYPQRNFYSSDAVIKSTGAETNLSMVRTKITSPPPPQIIIPPSNRVIVFLQITAV
jgi:hypothetical protein